MNIQSSVIGTSQTTARPWIAAMLAGFGGFLTIWVLAFARDVSALPLLIPPFGASCVLAFGYPASPFAQPKNIIGGHLVAAAIPPHLADYIDYEAIARDLALDFSVAEIAGARLIYACR